MNEQVDKQADSAPPCSAAARGSHRLGLWVAIAFLLAGLIATAMAGWYTKSEMDAAAKQEFAFLGEQIQTEILDRLHADEEVLHSVTAFYEASENVTRQEWRRFAENEGITQALPGVQGIGFVALIPDEQLTEHVRKIRDEGFPDYRVWPEGPRTIYSSVVFIEPFAGRNLHAFGHDMLTDPARRAAMHRARDQNAAALSGRVTLVQDARNEVLPGVVMYQPVYRTGMPHQTLAQRRAAIVGWVFSAYLVQDFVQSVLSGWEPGATRRIRLAVFEGEKTSPENLLYDSGAAGSKGPMHASMLELQIPMDSAGRRWTLLCTQNGGPAFLARYGKVWLVATAGTVVSLLLFGLGLSLWNTQTHSLQIAREFSSLYQRAEQSLLKSETTYRGLLEACPDAVVMSDLGGVVLFATPQTAVLLGISSSEELLGKRVFDYVNAEDRRRLAANMAQIIETGVRRNTEYTALRQDGTTVAVEASSAVIWDLERRPKALMSMIRDITQRKQVEEELLRTKGELLQYVATLESSNQTLKEFSRLAEAANRAKSEFLANMSHEIRTPMTAILGFADILAGNPTPEESAEAIKIIQDNGRSLLKLINDILDLSKIEAGRHEVQRLACSLRQISADVLSTMKVRADQKGLSLTLETIGPIPDRIRTDPIRLRQILVNLVGNAIKFTEAGGVRIVMQMGVSLKDEPQLRFDVIDTGIGMTAEQVAMLFQPFSQVDASARRRFGGTGLGLAISKRLAEMLDGNIEIRSTPGEGSTFTLTIAANLPEESPLQKPSENVAPQSAQPADHEVLHCRILLAEDGLVNQRLVSLVLSKAGAEVVVADNGQTAVELALSSQKTDHPFAAVLMDMQMPIMDGYEATRFLRGAGFTRPIIALTAHAMTEDREKCIDAGCNDYISKPIDQAILLDTVARCAGQHAAHDK